MSAIPVIIDQFGAAKDEQMPGLSLALDPMIAKAEFKRGLPRLSGTDGKARVTHGQVIRYKPGRRCVVEYKLRIERQTHPDQDVTVLGKSRARRFGLESCRLLEQFWAAGFESNAPDGISVPEPLGVIPAFKMWFQRKVSGQTATDLFENAAGTALARKIAEAIWKVHQANVPTERRHLISDELRILNTCLNRVAQDRPNLSARLDKLQHACHEISQILPQTKCCGIHRDFYPAQVIVDSERLHLIDFDLYCEGDPALDIGNFIGHITEHALRVHNDPFALLTAEDALSSRFVELSGTSPLSIQTYKTLTLARHVFLSTQLDQRQETTERLLQLCEQRLSLT